MVNSRQSTHQYLTLHGSALDKYPIKELLSQNILGITKCARNINYSCFLTETYNTNAEIFLRL